MAMSVQTVGGKTMAEKLKEHKADVREEVMVELDVLDAENTAKIDALDARIDELESRIEALESGQA